MQGTLVNALLLGVIALGAGAAADATMSMPVQTTPAPAASAQVGMPTYFSSTVHVTLLFDSWSTSEGGEYTLLLFIVFCGCAAVTLVKHAVDVTFGKVTLAGRLAAAFLYFNGSFAVMLVVMSYNIGVWFACMLGLTIGWMLGEWHQDKLDAAGECTRESLGFCH